MAVLDPDKASFGFEVSAPEVYLGPLGGEAIVVPLQLADRPRLRAGSDSRKATPSPLIGRVKTYRSAVLAFAVNRHRAS